MATGFDVKRSRPVPSLRHHLRRLFGRASTVLALVAGCLLVSACGGFYSADEITATVVDADTKAPLAGVHVIAEWAVRGGMNYGNVVGYMNVMETVTDKDGRFHFPGWGPRPNFHFGTIFQEAPGLILFKAGYRYTALENNGSVLKATPHKMRSDWDRQTIPMERHADAASAYDRGFIPLETDLEFLRREGYWRDVTRFLCAIGHERALRDKRHTPSILYTYQSLRDRGVNCPPDETAK